MVTNLVKKRPTNTVAAHGYFGRLIFQYAGFIILVLFTSSWLLGQLWVFGSLLLVMSTMAFNLNGFNFN